MPERTTVPMPEPLPQELVRWGIVMQTSPLALFSAAFLGGFYFLLEYTLHAPQPIFAAGYSIGAAIGWVLIVSSKTLLIWAVAKRNDVPFRLLWELVRVRGEGPAMRYWGSWGQNRALIFREVEIGRTRSEPQGDEP